MALSEAPWLENVSEGVVGRVINTAYPLCSIQWKTSALEIGKLVTICTEDPELPLEFWAAVVGSDGVRLLNKNSERLPPPGSLIIDRPHWREFINLSGKKTYIIGEKGSGKTFLSKLLLQTHLDVSRNRRKKDKLLIFDSTGEFIQPWSETYTHRGFIQRCFVNRLAIFSNAHLEEGLKLRKVSSMKFDLRELTPLEVKEAYHGPVKSEAERQEISAIRRVEWNSWCDENCGPDKFGFKTLIETYHESHSPLKMNLIGSLLNPSIDVIVMDVKEMDSKDRKAFMSFVTNYLEAYNDEQLQLATREEDDFDDLSLSSGDLSTDGKIQVYRDEVKCLIVQDICSRFTTKFPLIKFFEKDDCEDQPDIKIYLNENYRCSLKSQEFQEALVFETFQNVLGMTLLETILLKQGDIPHQVRKELIQLGLKSENEVLQFLNSSDKSVDIDSVPTLFRYLNSSVINLSTMSHDNKLLLNLYLLAELEKTSKKAG